MRKKSLDLSIVLVNYKAAELCIQCVSSIKTHTSEISYEIIIVDNASADGSKERVLGVHPDISWYDTGYNAGFSRANNLGANYATGKYLLLLNTDTLLVDNVLLNCYNRLEANSAISACSVLMLNNDLQPNDVDPNYTIEGTAQYSFIPDHMPLIKGWIHRKVKRLKAQLGNQEIDYLLGAFIFCRRADFQKLGGFDQNQFLYGEDVDLSLKLSGIGQIKYYEDLRIIHLEGGSTGKEERPITFYSRSPQMQLANIVFVRNWLGADVFLAIMLNYYLFIPIYFIIRIIKGILKFNVSQELKAPIQFTKQVARWSTYFFQILLQKPAFYKY